MKGKEIILRNLHCVINLFTCSHAERRAGTRGEEEVVCKGKRGGKLRKGQTRERVGDEPDCLCVCVCECVCVCVFVCVCVCDLSLGTLRQFCEWVHRVSLAHGTFHLGGAGVSS